MDDAAFARWSQNLEILRLSRKDEIEQSLRERADAFKPPEFYQLAFRSIESIMERWFSIEQESPVSSTKSLQNIRMEMDSIVDFEINAIEHDVAMITSRITWKPEELEESRKSFLTLADEVRKKYQIKLKSLSPAEVKSPLASEPLRPVQFSGSSARAGLGLTSILMLVVGLLIGGAVSLYFRDAEQKAETRFQEEKQKLLADQRALADNMALLHSSFADLVTGKSQSIPQLQAEMNRIQRAYDERADTINSDAADLRARLTKKLGAGDRLTRALDEVERDRKRRLKKVDEEFKPGLRVYEKRILLYKDLLGDQTTPPAPAPAQTQ